MDEDSYMVRSIDLASLCRPSNCYIYVAGGFSDRGINSVERYNCEIDSWDQMA